MNRERAIAVLKWGPYAKPVPTDKERLDALAELRVDPTIADELLWLPRPARPVSRATPAKPPVEPVQESLL